MYVCMYVCTYVCMYVRMYVCTYGLTINSLDRYWACWVEYDRKIPKDSFQWDYSGGITTGELQCDHSLWL